MIYILYHGYSLNYNVGTTSTGVNSKYYFFIFFIILIYIVVVTVVGLMSTIYLKQIEHIIM